MSTELHKTDNSAGQLPKHEDVSFESSDVETKSILAYLVYLAIVVFAAFAVCIYIFRYTTKFAAQSDTPPVPAHQGIDSREGRDEDHRRERIAGRACPAGGKEKVSR